MAGAACRHGESSVAAAYARAPHRLRGHGTRLRLLRACAFSRALRADRARQRIHAIDSAGGGGGAQHRAVGAASACRQLPSLHGLWVMPRIGATIYYFCKRRAGGVGNSLIAAPLLRVLRQQSGHWPRSACAAPHRYYSTLLRTRRGGARAISLLPALCRYAAIMDSAATRNTHCRTPCDRAFAARLPRYTRGQERISGSLRNLRLSPRNFRALALDAPLVYHGWLPSRISWEEHIFSR